MDTSYFENLISELNSRIEELETKVEKLDTQINKRVSFKDGIAETVEKLKSDFSDIESRVDDLENP